MELDAVTAAFVTDCKEAAASGKSISYTQMIAVLWTGGLMDDMREQMEDQGLIDKVSPGSFPKEIADGLAATVRKFGGLQVVDDLYQ